MHASAFTRQMFFGATFDKAVDPCSYLSLEKQSIATYLLVNFIKWVNPKEIMLGVVGISSYWNKLG